MLKIAVIAYNISLKLQLKSGRIAILLVYTVFQRLCYSSWLGCFDFQVGVAPDNQLLKNAIGVV